MKNDDVLPKIKAKARPSMEVKYWIKSTELMAWIMTSKRVPKTRSNWLKRPRSQSNDDQDNTLDVNQLKNIEDVRRFVIAIYFIF